MAEHSKEQRVYGVFQSISELVWDCRIVGRKHLQTDLLPIRREGPTYWMSAAEPGI